MKFGPGGTSEKEHKIGASNSTLGSEAGSFPSIVRAVAKRPSVSTVIQWSSSSNQCIKTKKRNKRYNIKEEEEGGGGAIRQEYLSDKSLPDQLGTLK